MVQPPIVGPRKTWVGYRTGVRANVTHNRNRRAGVVRAGQLAQSVMASPAAYMNERRDTISHLKRQLDNCALSFTPSLRAESIEGGFALVPGFDVDLRADIERARRLEAREGSGYVTVMGKPFKSASAARTTSPTYTASPVTDTPPAPPLLCDTPNPLEQTQPAVVVPPLNISEQIAGAANRLRAREDSAGISVSVTLDDSLAEDLVDLGESGSLSPRVAVNVHPLQDEACKDEGLANWDQPEIEVNIDLQSREGSLTDDNTGSLSGAALYKSWAQAAHNQGRSAYQGQSW